MALPIWRIVIPDQEQRVLRENIWNGTFADGFYVHKGNMEQIKLRYRGGHTREYKKKSYEIVKDGYTYHFNAEYDDPSMIRNALSFRFFELLGVPCPRTEHVLLFINGKSAGVYLKLEAVDQVFFDKRKIPVESLVYATNDDANFRLISPETNRKKSSLFDGYRLMIGSRRDKERLIQLITNLNEMNRQELYSYLTSKLDIDNYLRWLVGAVLTGNYDGFNQNYDLYYHKKYRYYRIIPWDYEGTWGRDAYGRLAGSSPIPITGDNLLTRRLLAYSSVRSKYKKMLQAALSSTFTTNRIAPIVKQMYRNISSTIHEDPTRRWSTSVFDKEPKLILSYLRERRAVVKKEMSKL
ncbi:CotH kinase family protein [Paenibacillus cremeus]|uniref:Spore coat protein CotH n=1 Tax=Paenibacillus cremeus TaxID=2163881 RepID=A0A559KHS2_9BACL|nr:CotH kinase family protein [Paenibacillus cremeus]TVY11680.1 spore coat protein CotH [Paenibacillus cremeus]